MADFTIMSGHFTIKANDGHFTETYEIDAASPQDALMQARHRWSQRRGARNAPVHEVAMAEAHKDEMREAMQEKQEEKPAMVPVPPPPPAPPKPAPAPLPAPAVEKKDDKPATGDKTE